MRFLVGLLLGFGIGAALGTLLASRTARDLETEPAPAAQPAEAETGATAPPAEGGAEDAPASSEA